MARRLLLILISSAIVLWGCGAGERGDGDRANPLSAAEKAYQEVAKKRKEIDAVEERLAITKAFLDEFPESANTARAIDAVFYYQGEQLGDMAGAVVYAEAIRDKVSSPDIARAVDKELIDLYGKSGLSQKMAVLADRLDAVGALDFNDHWNVIEGAIAAQDWELARAHCAKAKARANAQACRADYPDREFSEEELATVVNNRVGMVLVKDGWARANQGQLDEALADFAVADSLIPRYYFDIPEYDLNVYWAETLVMKGDFEVAIERLATDALIMRNEPAVAALRRAYVGMNGGATGFDAYADELHRRVARPIEDFEMADYQGNRHRFSDLRGDVTLLALWFPT